MSRKRAILYGIGIFVALFICLFAGVAIGNSGSKSTAQIKPLPTYTPYPTYTAVPTLEPQIVEVQITRVMEEVVRETVIIEKMVTVEVPASSDDTALQAEVDAYGGQLGYHFSAMGADLQTFSTLATNANPTDRRWIVQMGVIAGSIQAHHGALEAMTPPAAMEPLHQVMLDGSADCYASMSYLVDGVADLDPDAIDKATTLMSSCGQKLSNATKMIQ